MKIVCVHQGAELYGSDRAFISSVTAIRAAFRGSRIEVIVPATGPIVSFLNGQCDALRVEQLWVLRRKHIVTLLTRGLLRLPAAVFRAIKVIRENDLVYLNTCTLLDYLIAARMFSKKVILHVHEIPTGSGSSVLRRLVRSTNVRIIFNSAATQHAFLPLVTERTHVLYNGCQGPKSYRQLERIEDCKLRVLMLGRLSYLKGQDVLIRACGGLPRHIQRLIDVRIVGASFDSNGKLERYLSELVKACNCSSLVAFEPFADDPADWYRWCDIVVVPSRLPESFGRVPIEAMSFGRGAIVSATGGLTETVKDGITGLHVPPDNPGLLSGALARVALDRGLVRSFGRKARETFEAHFQQDTIDASFVEIIRTHLGIPTNVLTGATESECPS